ncbi:MAG: 50S ribosomal protein L5 [Candidatus Gracilibacteria bacterium]|jgi:large subunit ribosomal protein L5|nr:50S ribosomal protein L5 [Candidatus Gracilibacteria bacterium]
MSLQTTYKEEIMPALQKELGIKNLMATPKIEKITVNVGIGSILRRNSEKSTERFEETLAKITGQKPVVKKAKKSISNFKLREGMPVGVTVTLRGKRMYDFLERLIFVTIPRIKDFRGFARKGDGHGNLSIGIKEQQAFPEVGEVDTKNLHGIQITVTTSCNNDEEMFALFDKFGFPFKK